MGRHMDIERQFEDLGVDAITGVKLMQLTGISPDDFIDPIRFLRFKDVINFFKDIPDKEYLINRVLLGKVVDKLDHLWGYTQLLQQRATTENHIKELSENLDKVKFMPKAETDALKFEQELGNAQGELSKIVDHMAAYEK